MRFAGLLLLVWIVGGLLALSGGLTCAELSAMYPHSGGWYVFLNEAYGPLWGFLFGWIPAWFAFKLSRWLWLPGVVALAWWSK